MTMHRAGAVMAALCLLLAACDDRGSVTVGSKNFGESNVLAHMFAILAEEQGLDVAGPVEYPTTQSVLEALKRGDVDVYPDYNGTGLVMIGQNPMADGDAATARVQELYEPLGLTWLPRLGFANNYGLAMRADRAEELGITSISHLGPRADELTLGIEADFQVRPLDGLQPLTARYGVEFGTLDVVPLDERGRVYDKLIDGEIDVGEVYTTDGQIADYGMVVLEDDLAFFPAYEAAPLARTDTLAEHPPLRAALEALAGRIDAATMQALNSSVDIDGRPADAVARAALVEMGWWKAGRSSTRRRLSSPHRPRWRGPSWAAPRSVQPAGPSRAARSSSAPSAIRWRRCRVPRPAWRWSRPTPSSTSPGRSRFATTASRRWRRSARASFTCSARPAPPRSPPSPSVRPVRRATGWAA
jgi:glycine betaine/choline ABC-type transport system substrate-binding protein